mgnify:CR=1 FL=1
MYAAARLGRGHSEKTYETVIINELYARRIPALRQVKYYSNVEGNVVETGIVDIEVTLSANDPQYSSSSHFGLCRLTNS